MSSPFRTGPLEASRHGEVLRLVAGLPISAAFSWPPEALEPELLHAEGWGLWSVSGDLLGFMLWRSAGLLNEITCLATAPSSRRQGVMARLGPEVFETHPDAEWLLEVHETNRAAQALYLTWGFEKVAVRRRYYRDGADAWIFQRKPLAINPCSD